ncbi:MAG: hypothetical protein ABI415_05580 [Flavitalea sp.]
MNQKPNDRTNQGGTPQGNSKNDQKSILQKAEAQQKHRENGSLSPGDAKKTAHPIERHMTSKERGGIL